MCDYESHNNGDNMIQIRKANSIGACFHRLIDTNVPHPTDYDSYMKSSEIIRAINNWWTAISPFLEPLTVSEQLGRQQKIVFRDDENLIMLFYS
jgi:hypothetical protein